MTTTTTLRSFASRLPQKAAGFAAVLGLAGSVFLSLVPAAPVLAADPPSWAPAWGQRDHDKKHDKKHDKNKDDRDDGKRDDRHNRSQRRRDENNGNNDRNNDRYTPPQQDANRQKTKNDWRNLTILSGAATVYGLLKHDPTITFIGAAGTLYSASRYEKDRKSQSQTDRARAELFDRGNFDRDGVRYTKRDRWVNGEHFYYFAR